MSTHEIVLRKHEINVFYLFILFICIAIAIHITDCYWSEIASSHTLVIWDTRNRDRERSSGQSHLFNILATVAIDRTSGQPQVQLSLFEQIISFFLGLLFFPENIYLLLIMAVGKRICLRRVDLWLFFSKVILVFWYNHTKGNWRRQYERSSLIVRAVLCRLKRWYCPMSSNRPAPSQTTHRFYQLIQTQNQNDNLWFFLLQTIVLALVSSSCYLAPHVGFRVWESAFSLKVVGNEKNGGSGRSQMLRYGAGSWRSMFIYNLNMQF